MNASNQKDLGARLALVRAVRGIQWNEIPEEAREAAGHCLLGSLDVAAAGSCKPLTEILVSAIEMVKARTQVGLIGRTERASRLEAALVNSAAGQALDFDNTHTTVLGHRSVPVILRFLALGESIGASWRAILAAMVVGIEAECRRGAPLPARSRRAKCSINTQAGL